MKLEPAPTEEATCFEMLWTHTKKTRNSPCMMHLVEEEGAKTLNDVRKDMIVGSTSEKKKSGL